MTDAETALTRAEIYFRTYLHTVMPLHAGLVEGMCAAARPPLELATALEDIGQRYMDLASALNAAVIRSGRFDEEPEPEDAAEGRIAAFVADLVAGAGPLRFHDGTVVDGAAALERSPVVQDAVRAALHAARAEAREAAPALRPLPFAARF